jgi:hypothetical protein
MTVLKSNALISSCVFEEHCSLMIKMIAVLVEMMFSR